MITYQLVSSKASALDLHQEVNCRIFWFFFSLSQIGGKNAIYKIIFRIMIFIFPLEIRQCTYVLCLTLLWPVLRWLFTVFKWKLRFFFLQTQSSWLALSDLLFLFFFFPPLSNNYYIAFLTCLSVFDKSIITRFLFASLCPSFKGWIRLSQVHRALWDLTTIPFKARDLWIASRQFFPPFHLSFFPSVSIYLPKKKSLEQGFEHSAKKIRLHHLIWLDFFH